MPLQYVVLYLYVRLDLLAKQNLKVPSSFDEFLTAAKALTGGEQWGFGMRGGSGGHDSWMPFAFGTGAKPVKGGFVSPGAMAQNRYFVDLHRVHKVTPPSAPTDSFLQIVNNLKSGRVAMTVHHISTANTMVETFGDDSPRCQCRAGRTARASPPSVTAPPRYSALVRTRGPHGNGSLGCLPARTTCCTTRRQAR
jgi:multiple sugar transport system substrate-binding protein